MIRNLKSGQERPLSPKDLDSSDKTLQPTPRLQWFPDSRSLLLHYGNGELFRFDTRTGESQSLPQGLRIPALFDNEWTVNVVLAPDGRSIYYRPARDAKRIMRRDFSGGPERDVCRVQANRIQTFAVSGDGTRLAIVSFESGAGQNETRIVMTVAAAGGEPKEIFRSKSPQDRGKEIVRSRDGRHLFLLTAVPPGTRRADLMSLPAEGGEPRMFPMRLGGDFLALSPDGRRLTYTGGMTLRSELWMTQLPPRGAQSPR